MENPLVVPDSLDFHAECRAVDFKPIFRTRKDIHNHEPCQRKNITDNHGHLSEGYDCFEHHDEGNSDRDDNDYGDHGNTDGEDNSDEEDDSDSDWDGSDETDDGNDDSPDYDSEDDYPSENDSKPASPYREWIDYEPCLIPYFHLAAPQNKRELAIHRRKIWYLVEDLTASRDLDDRFTDDDHQDAFNYLAEQILAYEDLIKASDKKMSEEVERWNKELETNWELKRGKELDEAELRRGKELDEAFNDHRTPTTTE
ncbi:unnamed protein product [Aureobasidium pullulans]|nr:unnamed protein product [Aureobasidium pullulans]